MITPWLIIAIIYHDWLRKVGMALNSKNPALAGESKTQAIRRALAPPSAGALYFDPYDYEIDANPHPIWRRLRNEAPLYRNDQYDFYALSRCDDVLAASVDTETYSSAWGTVLEMMQDEPSTDGAMMIWLDPPAHTRLRKLVSRAFSPQRIAALEDEIRGIAVDYLDRYVGTRGFDYVADFGAKLPMMVIGAMLGVPEGDRDQIRMWTDEMLHREPGETNVSERLVNIHSHLWGYFGRYVHERRKHPQNDMMTDLLEAEVVDAHHAVRRLDDGEVIAFIGLLSGAGNETVARLIGWAGATLASFPEERQKLVDDPRKIANAVEELLRFEAPSPVQARRVTRDVEWYGTHVPKGAKMLLLTGSAGRDERRYPDPDRFAVDRHFERHVSFGYGIHFCLGASLARLEGRVALEETLRRFPRWQVDGERAEMVHTSTVRGWARLPIVVG
jgi:cytochrome P450